MIAPEIRSALTPNLIAIIGVGVALGILMLDTAGRIESRIDRFIAESQADVRAFQAQAAADRRAFQAEAAADRRAHRASMDEFGKRMDEFHKRMDEHHDYMQRLDERES
ncbi:MAG: hypothetical protein OXC28_06905 [Defluviicoccus sp.]|nr:hypothetical protein [Defluviicoccus sp.]